MSPNPITGRFESMAQAVAERVVALVVASLDVDALVQRVDVDKLVQRVDVDALVERVDVQRLVGELDMDALVEQTELGAIIAKSTTGVATEVLDVVRAQGVGLDDFFARWTNRVLRRDPSALPVGPGALVPSTTPALPPGRRPSPEVRR